jgi:hypothetical protein
MWDAEASIATLSDDDRNALETELQALAAAGDNGSRFYDGLGGTVAQIVTHLQQIKSDPAMFHLYAAAAFFVLNEDARALEQCNIALEINPNHEFTHIVLNILRQCTDRQWTREWAQSHQAAYPFAIMGGSHPDRPPSLRDALIGYQVYDSLQLASYMKDLDLYRRYSTRIDPCFVYVYAALLSLTPAPEFVELGGTLFAAYEKIRNCENLFCKGLDIAKVSMSNVEYSPFLAQAAKNLHFGIEFRTYREWHEVPTAIGDRVAYSMGVGSYAFTSSDEFAEWLSQSRFTMLREEFTLAPRDMPSQMSGKRFIYFSLFALARSLAAKGYRTHLIMAYPIEEKSSAGALIFGHARETLPGRTFKTAPFYLVVENLTVGELARFRASFDALDVSSCKKVMNGVQHGALPLSASLLDAPLDLAPYLQYQEVSDAPPAAPERSEIPAHEIASYDLRLLLDGLKRHFEALGKTVTW